MSTSTPLATCAATADDFLYGFDAGDEYTKLFLSSLITLGRVPKADLDELRDITLMRGVEEWDMLFHRASVLRERSGVFSGCVGGGDDGGGDGGDDTQTERSLLPFLGAVLTEERVQLLGVDGAEQLGNGAAAVGKRKRSVRFSLPRKKRSGKSVSHFFGKDGDAREKVGGRQPRQDSNSAVHIWTDKRKDEDDQALEGAAVSDAHPTAPVSPSVDLENLDAINGVRPDAVASGDQSPNRLTLPDRTVCLSLGLQQDTERPVKATGGSTSPFFGTSTPTREKQDNASPTPPSTRKRSRPPRGTVSSLPIPPLSADRFGLIQEELADDPFRLLIAITFLIRTTGKAAIPVFRQLMERFPTPEALATADSADIIPLIRPLGLSAVRCVAIQKYARMWLDKPPSRNVRYGVKNYPRAGDGRHVRVMEEFGPEDDHHSSTSGEGQPVDAVSDARERAIGCAWEIGHLTQGPYALDSWRIFCRDLLLGRSSHWTGKGNPPQFQPEWMRVLPRDKELRACLRWMWMREGWELDPLTGEREPLREEMRRAVDEGRVRYDDSGNLVIIEQGGDNVG